MKRKLDFAGSDSLLTEEQYEEDAEGDLKMIPMLAGAVVPVYNLPGTLWTCAGHDCVLWWARSDLLPGVLSEDPKLVLDRALLVDIFMGMVMFEPLALWHLCHQQCDI